MATSRNMGRFEISEHFIRERVDAITKIMSDLKIVVVRAENRFGPNGNTLHYVGISDKFRGVKLGEMIPKYDLIFTEGEDGHISCEAKERE